MTESNLPPVMAGSPAAAEPVSVLPADRDKLPIRVGVATLSAVLVIGAFLFFQINGLNSRLRDVEDAVASSGDMSSLEAEVSSLSSDLSRLSSDVADVKSAISEVGSRVDSIGVPDYTRELNSIGSQLLDLSFRVDSVCSALPDC